MIKMLLLAPLFVSLSIPANGEVILSIDISDPSAVVFTSTPVNAQNTFIDVGDGIVLLNFTGDVGADGPCLGCWDYGPILVDSGALGALDSSTDPTRIFIDSWLNGTFDKGYEVYYTPGNLVFFATDLITFLDSARALTGSLTHHFAGRGMPETGTTGDVVVFAQDRDHVIGQWEVVAGPSECAPSELSETGDFDGDSACDVDDNCALIANVDQLDTNEDGVGDGCQCGDADGNGLLNVADTLLISRCSTGAIPCDGLLLCDANGDGACNVGDRRVISRCINGAFSCTSLSCVQKDG